MSNILVTGAAGFIGYWTADALAARGDTVVGIDNFNSYYNPALKRARAERLRGKVSHLYKGDITDGKLVGDLLKNHKIGAVVHLAAQAGVRYSLTQPFAYETANNLGTLTLLEKCREVGVKTFVFASSSSVYGGNTKVPFSVEDRVDKPVSLYAATKRYNELLAYTYHHLYGLRCTGLRFFTVYGPWGRPDMAYYKFTDAIHKGEPIEVYNHGKMRRDFTYITDIVDGVLAALDKNYKYEIFNLGNSKSIDLSTFIGCIESAVGKKAVKKLKPIQPGEVVRTYADIKKSTRKLGFRPKVSIQNGIKEFVQWYLAHHFLSQV